MDKNYFSDITELFIKAKKAEKINVNPHSKAAIREMLAYKIDQIKTSAAEPKEGFFSKWKFQLMGVPASLFAVFMVVFAFQNLQITMPKEDFAPGATEGSSMEQSEAESTFVSDTPVIEEIEIKEEPELKSQPKPELMVIDYGTTSTPTPKTGGGTYTPPSYTPPAETVDPPALVAPVVESPTLIQPEPITTESVLNETYTPPTVTSPQPTPTPPTGGGVTYISNDPTEGEDLTPKLVIPPKVDMPGFELNPDTVHNLMDGSIALPKAQEPSEEGAINEYRDPFNPLVPEFNAEALNTIEKPDSLSNVNVHYLNNSQAAVEIVEDGTTRWYMFEDRAGTWTVTQKFD
jgi:hypothetical protein